VKPEVAFSPTNLVFAAKDKIMKGSDILISRESILNIDTLNPQLPKAEQTEVCPTIETTIY
jgi:hypothetical protein